MKVYHGSTVVVNNPIVNIGRENLDFGKGFYVTDLQTQAEKWVQRFLRIGEKAFVNVYEFDDSGLEEMCRLKKFSEYNEEWLDFVLNCRSGKQNFLNYDIIEGGIANDKVFDTVELYFDGLIQKTEALKRLKFEKPNNQICFVNQKILDELLHFEKFYEVIDGE